jgi:hypothetical protein
MALLQGRQIDHVLLPAASRIETVECGRDFGLLRASQLSIFFFHADDGCFEGKAKAAMLAAVQSP